MQLIFDESTSTVWLFATPNDLLQIVATAQERIREARLGEDLTIFEKSINRSDLIFRISTSKDSELKETELGN